MLKKEKKLRRLAAANAVLVLVALALSLVSSEKAYAFDVKTVALCCGVTVALDLLCLLLGEKLPGTVADLIFFAGAVLTAIALCTVIQGRILLIGYIYFSDLESSNPVAIAAMNLAIAAFVCYALALAANFIIGFSKHAKD